MDASRTWRVYLALLGLLVGGVIGLQIANLTAEDQRPSTPASPLLAGDWLVKQAMSGFPGIDPERSARQAIAQFRQALPSPAASRRIGVVKEAILGESGTRDFTRIASPAATRGLSAQEVSELRSETEMWLRIYGPERLSVSEARRCVARISRLDIGPVGRLAVADVYRRAGQHDLADAAARRAREGAARSIAGMAILGFALVVGAVVGLVLAAVFLTRSAGELAASPPPRIQPSVLMIGFFVYFGGVVVLGVLMQIVGTLGGLDSNVAFVLLQSVAVVGAFALGWSALRAVTACTGEDLAEMGLRALPARQALRWGVGGYLAALPFVGMALTIWYALSQTLFRNVPTPNQPFGPVVAEGGVLGAVAVFVLAGVIAPIVEETFFRGALYGALRARLRVWPATLLAAGVFAVAHPLPGGFLPIFVLACVLTALREKTGSLVPSMICHALYNSVVLLIFLLAA